MDRESEDEHKEDEAQARTNAHLTWRGCPRCERRGETLNPKSVWAAADPDSWRVFRAVV